MEVKLTESEIKTLNNFRRLYDLQIKLVFDR